MSDRLSLHFKFTSENERPRVFFYIDLGIHLPDHTATIAGRLLVSFTAFISWSYLDNWKTSSMTQRKSYLKTTCIGCFLKLNLWSHQCLNLFAASPCLDEKILYRDPEHHEDFLGRLFTITSTAIISVYRWLHSGIVVS